MTRTARNRFNSRLHHGLQRPLRNQPPAARLERVVRIGGAWTTFRDRRLKIHEAVAVDGDGEPGCVTDEHRVGTGAGMLELVLVQPEGKPRMLAAEWARGAHPSGECFT